MLLSYLIIVLVAWVGQAHSQAPYGITVSGVKCGVKTCKLSEYCSSFDKTCQSCSDICDNHHHNYDEPLCEKECQDYLHDLRYARKGGKGDDDTEELRATVSKLSRMVTVNLTLVCLMLITLASFLCFQLYRWKVKKNITLASLKAKFCRKRQANDGGNPKNVGDNKKPDLRLEMPTNGSNSDHSPVTVTTSISRRPAEDSTLDYAYDNPAMSSPR